MRSRWALVSVMGLSLVGLDVACGQRSGDDAPAVEAIEPLVVDGGHGPEAAVDVVPATEDHGPWAYALALVTPVMHEGSSQPIGYLRQGSKVHAKPELRATARCAEGAFDLGDDAFVCARYATFDPNHPRLKDAPRPAALDQALPYRYGYNVGNGTPLYRWIPSRDDRLTYEPWRNPDPMRVASDGEDPWYLRDWDGGKPQVTLDDLKGEGPIARRMVKGFYVALDSEGAGMWKTTTGNFVPKERIWVPQPLTDFHGVWLGTPNAPAWPPAVAQKDGGTPAYWIANPPTKLPVWFVLDPRSKRWVLNAERTVATAGDAIARYTPVALTGNLVELGDVTYFESEGGTWLRSGDGVMVKPGALPADLAPGEKWIDVDLATQSLVAFEFDRPVFATLISSGKYKHDTPRGTFHVREKHVAASMDGDGANDGVYSIEDVPWIMYFSGGYALHGAFWHSNFGHRQSHGCVNLAPSDARAMFDWTAPHLPEGWHGVSATDASPGTRVVIH